MLKLLIGGAIALSALVGGYFAGHQTPAPTTPPPSFGAFSPTGGSTYRLGQSIGVSDTSFKLSSFKEPVSNILYTMSYLGSDVEYGTIAPQSSVSEFVSFTGITQNSDGSATLTGVTRGLTRTPAGSACAASTTLAQSHAGQSIFILSDSPCLFSEYTPLRTNATSSAVLTFSSTTPPRLDQPGLQSTGTYISTTSEFASIAYVNKIAISGASNATQSVKGIIQLGTGTQFASSTILGSTGASLVPDSSLSTSSPYTTGSWNVWTQPNAKIKQTFLDLTEGWTFSSSTLTVGNIQTANVGTLNVTGSQTGLSGKLGVNTSPTNVTGVNASTTVAVFTVPANTLGTSGIVRMRLYVSAYSDSNAGTNDRFELAYGNATTTYYFNNANQHSGDVGIIDFIVSGSGATNTQKLTTNWGLMIPPQIAAGTLGITVATTTNLVVSTTGAVDSTQAQKVMFVYKPSNTTATFTTDQVTAEIIK